MTCASSWPSSRKCGEDTCMESCGYTRSTSYGHTTALPPSNQVSTREGCGILKIRQWLISALKLSHHPIHLIRPEIFAALLAYGGGTASKLKISSTGHTEKTDRGLFVKPITLNPYAFRFLVVYVTQSLRIESEWLPCLLNASCRHDQYALIHFFLRA